MCVVRVYRLCLYKMAKRRPTRNIVRSLSVFRFASRRFVWLIRWLVAWQNIYDCEQPLTWLAEHSCHKCANRQWTAVFRFGNVCCVGRSLLPCEATARTLEIIEQTKSQFIMRLLKTHNFLFVVVQENNNKSFRSPFNVQMASADIIFIHMPYWRRYYMKMIDLEVATSCENRKLHSSRQSSVDCRCDASPFRKPSQTCRLASPCPWLTPETICFDLCDFAAESSGVRPSGVCVHVKLAHFVFFFFSNFPIRCGGCIENQFQYNLISSIRIGMQKFLKKRDASSEMWMVRIFISSIRCSNWSLCTSSIGTKRVQHT